MREQGIRRFWPWPLCLLGIGCNLLPHPEDLVVPDPQRVVTEARDLIATRVKQAHGAGRSHPKGDDWIEDLKTLPPGMAAVTSKHSLYKRVLAVAVHDDHVDIDVFNGNEVRLGARIYSLGADHCLSDMATPYKDVFWYNVSTDAPATAGNCP